MVVIMKSTTKPGERKGGTATQLATRIAKPDTKAVSKAKRVFKKAGVSDPTDAEIKSYLTKLAETDQKSSRPLAKQIREGK